MGNPKIAFVGYPFKQIKSGIARGYQSLAYYVCEALQRTLGEDQVPIVPLTGGHPRIHLHICPPHRFEPVPGKTNVVLTMWETHKVPSELIANIARADGVIAPSRYVWETFRKAGLNVAKVPLGVHESFLKTNSSRRIIEKRRLRILWVGAPNERKGYQLLEPSMRLAFGDASAPPILYVKSIAPEPMLKEIMGGRVIIDTRDLGPSAMLDLYQTADIFLSTSYGEGFGLCMLEAMAAGALAVGPIAGGHLEFMKPTNSIQIRPGAIASFRYGVEVELPVPTPETIATTLRAVCDAWGTPAIEQRRRAGVRDARALTWTRTAEGIAKMLWSMKDSQAA